MKKTLKLIAVSLLSVFVVACGKTEEKPAEAPSQEASSQTDAEVSQTQETSQESKESDASNTDDTQSEESQTSETDENEDKDETAETGEKTEDSVTFNFYVSGQEEPIAQFYANDVEGKSVYEAMEGIEGLDFTFDEDEQVIGEIQGYTNDYVEWTTWTYLYNGQFAEVGPKSQTLEKGDVIDWYYGTTDELPVNIIPAE